MLETIFNNEDVRDIYHNIVMYSVLRYGQLDIRWREHFEDRYRHALSCFGECQIDDNILKYESISGLKACLDQYQVVYDSVLDGNKKIVNQYGPLIEKMVVNACPRGKDLDKISFLFAFVTCYIRYSNDYFRYCLQTPPVDGYIFDFQDCVPVDSSINGMLVMGQGLCDDIANLMIYLGRLLQLDIGKVFARYRGNLHSFNSIVLEDQTYFMDATRVIRGDMLSRECFLVGERTLNKNKDYDFETDLLGTDYVGNIPDYVEVVSCLLDKIEEVRPKAFNLSLKKKG